MSSARTSYESKLANMNNTKRKMNADLQDTIISTYQDFKQYCKGVREFADEDFQTSLHKYLLKTTGTVLVNTCFAFVSDKNDDVTSSEVEILFFILLIRYRIYIPIFIHAFYRFSLVRKFSRV